MMCHHPSEAEREDARIEESYERPGARGLVYDREAHGLGECRASCGYCWDTENKTDPCPWCGDDMDEEGHAKLDGEIICQPCYQREYDRTYDKAKGEEARAKS
jgi:hypothetical protein